MKPLLEVNHCTLFKNVQKTPGEKLLSFEQLTLSQGQITTLSGPSGSGKTTLLKFLARLVSGDGDILFSGQPASDFSPSTYRSKIMYLSQMPYFITGNIEENILAPQKWKTHKDRNFDQTLLDQYFHNLHWPQGRLQQSIKSLSGGEKQIVHLLRALLLNPRVLLLDEPTSSLDPATTLQCENLVKQWVQENGTSVFWSTHSLEQLRRVGDRSCHIHQGQLEIQ